MLAIFIQRSKLCRSQSEVSIENNEQSPVLKHLLGEITEYFDSPFILGLFKKFKNTGYNRFELSDLKTPTSEIFLKNAAIFVY